MEDRKHRSGHASLNTNDLNPPMVDQSSSSFATAEAAIDWFSPPSSHLSRLSWMPAACCRMVPGERRSIGQEALDAAPAVGAGQVKAAQPTPDTA